MKKYRFTFRRFTLREVTEVSRRLFAKPVTYTREQHLRFSDVRCTAIATSEAIALMDLRLAHGDPPQGRKYRYILEACTEVTES